MSPSGSWEGASSSSEVWKDNSQGVKSRAQLGAGWGVLQVAVGSTPAFSTVLVL